MVAAEIERNGKIQELLREVKFTRLCDSLEREGGVEDAIKRWQWRGEGLSCGAGARVARHSQLRAVGSLVRSHSESKSLKCWGRSWA